MVGGRRGEVSAGDVEGGHAGEEGVGEEDSGGPGAGTDGGHLDGGGGGHGEVIDRFRPWPRSLMSEISDMSRPPR
jgi:hypothetical protein